MRILAIETSCDETAIAIIESDGGGARRDIKILANITLSQIEIHKKWGGVVPGLAKRAHAEHLVPILKQALGEAGLLHPKEKGGQQHAPDFETLFEREPALEKDLHAFTARYKTPHIDALAVTVGPGLEPALWVGVNFARGLCTLWGKRIIPINHMEGHVFSALIQKKGARADKSITIRKPSFPSAALLVSGGHTELLLVRDWLTYERLGETRDDAAGEAFDKVARILRLPYPGGPEIARLAQEAHRKPSINLPRPMLDSGDYDFSFSGIKTAVLYMTKREHNPDDTFRRAVAREFEEAVTDVLTAKTERAARAHGAQSIIAGGGVAANRRLREKLSYTAKEKLSVPLFLPDPAHTGDNALMIAVAALTRVDIVKDAAFAERIVANGNLILRTTQSSRPAGLHENIF